MVKVNSAGMGVDCVKVCSKSINHTMECCVLLMALARNIKKENNCNSYGKAKNHNVAYYI